MKNTRYWTLHLVAGFVMFFLLGIHIATIYLGHFFGYEEPLSYASVVMRAKQVFYLVMYVLLLGAGLYHGLYGFRKIVFELSIGRVLEKILTVCIVTAGIVMFISGAFVVIGTFIKSV